MLLKDKRKEDEILILWIDLRKKSFFLAITQVSKSFQDNFAHSFISKLLAFSNLPLNTRHLNFPKFLSLPLMFFLCSHVGKGASSYFPYMSIFYLWWAISLEIVQVNENLFWKDLCRLVATKKRHWPWKAFCNIFSLIV